MDVCERCPESHYLCCLSLYFSKISLVYKPISKAVECRKIAKMLLKICTWLTFTFANRFQFTGSPLPAMFIKRFTVGKCVM